MRPAHSNMAAFPRNTSPNHTWNTVCNFYVSEPRDSWCLACERALTMHVWSGHILPDVQSVRSPQAKLSGVAGSPDTPKPSLPRHQRHPAEGWQRAEAPSRRRQAANVARSNRKMEQLLGNLQRVTVGQRPPEISEPQPHK